VDSVVVSDSEGNSLLKLDIESGKNVYGVGEPFSAEYHFSHSLDPFRGRIVRTNSRSGRGLEGDFYGTLGMTFNPDETYSDSLMAFERFVSETETRYSCCRTSFVEAGGYNFEVDAFDCIDVEKAFDEDCWEVHPEDIRSEVKPLISAQKTIVVVENE